jgi:hypothetical protein
VYYGFSRDLSLQAFVKTRAEALKKTRYEELVEEAKIAFETQHNREQAILATAEGVASIDANSYKFDAEKWINFALAQSEKDAAAVASASAAKK